MPDLDTFLAEQGITLMHRAPREFDESKVKRKGGKFAKKAGPNDVKDEPADADWMKPDSLNNKLDQITKDVGPAFSEVVKGVLDKFKLKSRADLAKNPEARAEAVKAAVQVLNNYAENRGVSPSGKSKIQYRVGNHGHIIAGVVKDGKYTVIPKTKDTTLRLEPSAPPRPTAKPTTSPFGIRPTSTTVDRPPTNDRASVTKPPTQRPSASAAVDKKPNPFRNTSALERRADRQAAIGEVDDTLQKFLDKVKKKKLTHDDVDFDDNFLEHFGIKGMRWGFRKENSSSGAEVASVPGLSGPGLSAAQIKEHNDRTAHYSKTIHAAKNEAEIEHILDNAHLNGYMEGNIKVSSIDVSQDLKKVNYELKLYSLTPGKPNNSAEDGVKVEYINKSVDRLKPGHGWSHADAEAERRKAYDDYVAEAKKALGHDDMTYEEYLEHHGIKGMRWGVRRTDAQLGRLASFKQKFSRKKDDNADEAKGKASGGDSKRDDAPSAKSGGSSDHISADHERLLDSMGKRPEEMTTQELQLATNRAMALQNYQRTFAPERKSELQAKVDRLNLEKQYRDLNASLNPPQKSKLAKLASGAEKGFNTYQKVDKLVGGDLSKALSRKLGLKPEPTENEKVKAMADLAKWKHNAAKDTVQLHELSEKNDLYKLKSELLGIPHTSPSAAATKAAWDASIAEDKASAAIKFGTSTTASHVPTAPHIPTHRAPTFIDKLREANHKPSDDLPTLLDVYKAEAKARKGTPDLMTQVRRGRHRK